jgi:pimeloyl-ACP methyl ester carboxylesterase
MYIRRVKPPDIHIISQIEICREEEYMEPKKGFVDVNGTRIYYEESGKGTPLVMIHAGIANLRMWDEQMPVFAKHFRVIRYDLRGYGQSEMGLGPYSHSGDLRDFLAGLEIEKAILLGCSMGGMAALDFAVQHPERVIALVAVAAGLSGFAFEGEPPPYWEEMEAAEQAGDYPTAADMDVRIWLDSRYRTPLQIDPALRMRVYELALEASRGGPLRQNPTRLDPPAAERLETLTMPLLAIAGDFDDPNVQAIADLLNASVPQSKKVVFTETAHLPNLERPEAFNQIVLAFLSAL